MTNFNLTFSQYLLEVEVMGKFHNKPLRDDKTIRVYHGFNRIEDAIIACTHGISGKTDAQRIYSYESNNNPKGLFVTPDLKTAKEFGRVVIEIHTKVSDLDSPVWPGGTFTGQGQMSQNFKDDEEREERRLSDREMHRKSDRPEVSKSDRPEVAASLSGGEPQALYMGDLNANSIRAVWVGSEVLGDEYNYKASFIRLSRNDFIKRMKEKVSSKDIQARGRSYRDDAAPSIKLFSPREEFSEDVFRQRVAKEYKTLPFEQVITILKSNPDYVNKFFWPKQIPEFTKFVNSL